MTFSLLTFLCLATIALPLPVILFTRYGFNRSRLKLLRKELAGNAGDFWLDDAEKASFRTAAGRMPNDDNDAGGSIGGSPSDPRTARWQAICDELSRLPQARWLAFNEVAHSHLKTINALLAWLLVLLAGCIALARPLHTDLFRPYWTALTLPFTHDIGSPFQFGSDIGLIVVASVVASLAWGVTHSFMDYPGARFTPMPARVTLDNIDHPAANEGDRTFRYRALLPLGWLIISTATLCGSVAVSRGITRPSRELAEEARTHPIKKRPHPEPPAPNAASTPPKPLGLPATHIGDRLDPAVVAQWPLARVRYEENLIYASYGAEFPRLDTQEWANNQRAYRRVEGKTFAAAEAEFTEADHENMALLRERKAALERF